MKRHVSALVRCASLPALISAFHALLVVFVMGEFALIMRIVNNRSFESPVELVTMIIVAQLGVSLTLRAHEAILQKLLAFHAEQQRLNQGESCPCGCQRETSSP